MGEFIYYSLNGTSLMCLIYSHYTQGKTSLGFAGRGNSGKNNELDLLL